MYEGARISVIIPALNEERSIGKVIDAIPGWVDEIIVVDNGSMDNTGRVAREHGARVIREPRPGYGMACLTGMSNLSYPDIVVFVDADFSDEPDKMDQLVAPIAGNQADLVIGSRMLGKREPGALTPQQRFGNTLACFLVRLFWGQPFTDLGPFRAIRYSTLQALGMCDPNYGWTVEMQIKAAQRGVRSAEVPVNYRRRIGRSKISGTLRGVVGAGTKILYTIFRAALSRPSAQAAVGSPSVTRDAMIVFTRFPEAGKTKTRLIPALGPEGAADLQRQMAEHTISRVKELAEIHPLVPEIHFEGGDEKRIRTWLNVHWPVRPQADGDLGQRMQQAFQAAFDAHHQRVVIIGIDCPAITPRIIQSAFEQLESNDMVLGPATDGGYYLIGLRRMPPEIFKDVAWGTEKVREQTLNIAGRLGLSAALLDMLADVDLPEDLPIWEDALRESELREAEKNKISVIIPALNESDHIERAVKSASAGDNVELIVVDGGSTDATIERAQTCGARVIQAPACRAVQMNAGAAAATGNILLFLHGDTILPNDFERHVHLALERPDIAAGAFQLKIDAPLRLLRLVERVINWRSRCLQLPYGDQAPFMKAIVFRELGAFPEKPIMEDYEFVRALRRRGRIIICNAHTTTSARRWINLGVFRVTLINQIVIAAYHLGVPADRIARFYRRNV